MSSTAQIQLRHDTAAHWTSVNPTLLAGEVGLETDTLKAKVGDGTHTWTQLSYFNQAPTINVGHGQASKMTSGTITIATAGTYQSTGLTATFDTTYSTGIVLGTSDTFGLKNTSGSTKLYMVQASMDATAGNNQTLGIKLAKNGTPIAQSECQAFTGSSSQVTKLYCFWMVELANNDEVALYCANISNTTAIAFQRGRIAAVEVL